jgi:hypothetical protein
LIITSIYYGYFYSKKHQLKHLFGCIAVMSFSLFVRYPSALVIFPVTLFVIYNWIKSIRKPLHFIVLILPIGIYFLHIYFEQNTTDFLDHGALAFWSVKNYFSSTFHTDQGVLSFTFPNILFMLYPVAHYGFMLFGILFIFMLIKNKKVNHTYIFLCIVSYLSYVLFVAGITTQNNRHLLLLYPLILVICYYGYEKTIQFSVIDNYKKLFIGLGMVFQIILCVLAFKTIFIRNQLEKNIAQKLVKYENNTLYSFDIDIALKSRETNFKHLNLWQKEYVNFEKGGLVLFNEERFKIQWKGENPMINWEHLNNNYHLVKLESYTNNWILYRIE